MHPYEMADTIHYICHVPEENHIYSRTYQWLRNVCTQWRIMARSNWESFHQSFPLHTIATERARGNNACTAPVTFLYEATRIMYFVNTEDALKDFDDAVERGLIEDPTQVEGWSRGFVAADLSLGNGPPGTLTSVIQRVQDDLEEIS